MAETLGSTFFQKKMRMIAKTTADQTMSYGAGNRGFGVSSVEATISA
jgi:hypothetical protein